MSNKKKGCLHSFLVFVIVIVVILVLIIGGIMGGSMFFKQNIPDPVAFTDNDEASFYEKANISKENYSFSMMDLLQGNVLASGSVEVDTTFSSEELTAFFSGHSTQVGQLQEEKAFKPVRMKNLLMSSIISASPARASYSASNLFADFNIRVMSEDKLEVFAKVSEDISGIYDIIDGLENYAFIVDRGAGSNVHIVMRLSYNEGRGFDSVVEALRVNGVPVPQNFVDRYEADLNDLINRSLQNNGSFNVEVFKITDNEVIFKGSMPEYLQSIE